MSKSRDRELLRRLEMIARVKPDPDDTTRVLAAVRQRLTGEGGQETVETARDSGRLRIGWRPGLAVAAVVGLSCGCWFLLQALSPRPATTDGPPVVSEHPLPEQAPAAQPAENAFTVAEPCEVDLGRGDPVPSLGEQLDQVTRWAANLDLDALRSQLNSPVEPVRRLAARYLGQLGVEEDLSVLQKLASTLDPGPGGNPYAEAATQLERRLASNSSGPSSRGDSTDHWTPAPAGPAVAILSGVVRDAQSNEPLSEAVITLHGRQTYQAETRADGTYGFGPETPAGLYEVTVNAPGYLAIREQDERPLVSLDPNRPQRQLFYLTPGCRVRVTVVDTQGRTVPGAEIHLAWTGLDDESPRDACPPRRSDGDGQAVLDAVAASTVPYELAVVHPEYAPATEAITCRDPNRIVEAVVVLHVGRSLEGLALLPDQSPAAGIPLVARPQGWRYLETLTCVISGESGRFVLEHLLAGSYDLFAGKVSVSGTRNWRRIATFTYPIDDPPLRCTVPFAIEPQDGVLTGTVLWTTEQATDQIAVMAWRMDGDIGLYAQALQLDGNRFRLDGLAPGRYRLLFEGPQIRQTLYDAVDVPGSDLVVTLTCEPQPELAGQVVDAGTGLPVRQFRLSLQKLPEFDMPSILPASTWQPFDHPEGLFKVNSQGPGIYRLQVVAPGYVPWMRSGIDTDDPRRIEVVLTRGLRLEGTVESPDGVPLDGATVTLMLPGETQGLTESPWSARTEISTTTKQGHFVFDAAPAGPVAVRVEHPSYRRLVLPNVLPQDGVPLVLTLMPLP